MNYEEIIEGLKSEDEKLYFEEYYNNAEEVILFGSYAQNLQTEKSDIDILFVLEGKPFRTGNVDFVTIAPLKVLRKSWLGSEIANHVSKYGVWLKGKSEWKNHTFVSRNSVLKKKTRIYNRLIQIYLKKDSLQAADLRKLYKKVVFDFGRLLYLVEKESVPPTSVVKNRLRSLKDPFDIFVEEHFLGAPGRELVLKTLGSKSTFEKILLGL